MKATSDLAGSGSDKMSERKRSQGLEGLPGELP